jgi:hypothetical protein
VQESRFWTKPKQSDFDKTNSGRISKLFSFVIKQYRNVCPFVFDISRSGWLFLSYSTLHSSIFEYQCSHLVKRYENYFNVWVCSPKRATNYFNVWVCSPKRATNYLNFWVCSPKRATNYFNIWVCSPKRAKNYFNIWVCSPKRATNYFNFWVCSPKRATNYFNIWVCSLKRATNHFNVWVWSPNRATAAISAGLGRSGTFGSHGQNPTCTFSQDTELVFQSLSRW